MDFSLFLDLQRLYASHTAGIAPYLRHIAASEWESGDDVPFAAWLLGKFGNSDDLLLLRRLRGGGSCPMGRKNISEAMEALDSCRPAAGMFAETD